MVSKLCTLPHNPTRKTISSQNLPLRTLWLAHDHYSSISSSHRTQCPLPYRSRVCDSSWDNLHTSETYLSPEGVRGFQRHLLHNGAKWCLLALLQGINQITYMKVFHPKGNYGSWPHLKNHQETRSNGKSRSYGGDSAEANPALPLNVFCRHMDSRFQK